MGTKAQRQNQHARRLMMKIKKFEAKNKNTEGLSRELAYCMGETTRPVFKTGRECDPRLKKFR
jgi:hypothetical protein